MRRRPPSVVAMALAATAAVAAVAVTGCGSDDDDGGDAEAFCAEVAANTTAIVAPAIATEDDVDATLGLYRDLADLAPLAIEEEWRDLLVNVETASTVDPTDPESMQRTAAVAYATEKSAVAVRNWILANCGIDLGPVATIAPQEPAATTTLAPGISTSLVTVQPPPTTTIAVPTATEPSVTTPPVTTTPVAVPPATGTGG